MHSSIRPLLVIIIWKLPLPEKCWLFNRLCYHKKLLTTEILAKKGLFGLSRCTLWYNHEEDADHLFTTCKFSSGVWISLQSRHKVKTLPHNLHDLWVNRRSSHMISRLQKASDIISAITCWSLWKERNNRIFCIEPRTGKEVVKSILFLACSWLDENVLTNYS